jgi:hypothetical protein
MLITTVFHDLALFVVDYTLYERVKRSSLFISTDLAVALHVSSHHLPVIYEHPHRQSSTLFLRSLLLPRDLVRERQYSTSNRTVYSNTLGRYAKSY